MAQSNPQASYTDPQQPRRSSRLPKPAYRDPNFIYEDLQRQLDNFDDVDERYLLPSPSLFSDLQDHDRKETKRKVKRASSKQPTKVSDPGRQFAELQSKLHDLNLYDLGQDVLPPTDQKPGKITQSPSTHHQLPQPSASPERDLQQEIRLAELQKENLALELQVLRLRHAPVLLPMANLARKQVHLCLLERLGRSALSTGHTSLPQVLAIVLILIRLIYHSS